MKYVAGVDEAGRGPVLGPMVMSIVAIRPQDKATLNKLGVKDSKEVAKNKRVKLSRHIRDLCPSITIKVSPQDIDKALLSETSSLNELEAKTTATLIKRLVKIVEVEKVMLDLPSKNKDTYLTSVRKYLPKKLEKLVIDAEFKADQNYVEVSAASILAKVARDKQLESQSKQLGFNLGSGYPSDPHTQQVVKDKLPLLVQAGIVRTQWKTVKETLEQKSQSKLGDF